MKTIFLSLVVSFALALSSWSLYAVEQTATEFYLSKGHEYTIEDKTKVLEQLFKIVAEIEAKQEKSAEDFLLLGDTYHWLGHIAEEAEHREKAEIYYQASYMAYKQTPIRTSQRINDLNGVRHATFHLSKNAKLVLATAAMRLREHVEFALEIGGPDWAEKVYNLSEEARKEQADNVDSVCAKYLTKK